MDSLICKKCGWTMNPNPIDGYSLCERCEGETEPLTTEEAGGQEVPCTEGLVAAAEYIEILEKHINNLKAPTRFSGYIGPHDSDISRAKGRWCAAKAIAELGH